MHARFHRSVFVSAGVFALLLIPACSTSPLSPEPASGSSSTVYPETGPRKFSPNTDTPPVYHSTEFAFTEPSREDPLRPTLEAYIRFSLDHSPLVAQHYHAWQAAKARSPQVASWPDPKLMVGVFLEPVETRTGPQRARIGIQQSLPLSSRLEDLKNASERDALAAYQQLQAVQLDVARDVIESLHDLSYTDSATRIAKENLALLESFESVVRTQYKVGSGSHPDLIRVQVEIGKLKDRLRQLRDLRPSYTARVNALLHRPTDTPINPCPPIPSAIASSDIGDLIDRAHTTNPQLLALDEKTAAYRHLQSVAQAQRVPDLTVGLDYIVTDHARMPGTEGSGNDPIMVTFGVNLPIWGSKYEASEAEALSKRISSSYARSATANDLASAIHKTWFEHTDSHDRVVLYQKTLIPQAEQSLHATMASFRAGKSSILDLIDTQRTLLNFALAEEEAVTQRGKSLARLNALVGQPIETIKAE